MFIKSDSVVTVSVITYNSSRFVLETLESVKAQTYQPLILHICDDCSTDDTIKICENWIADNKKRFIDTKIIVPEHNTGVSGNLNRAFDACNTEWLKSTAGDDILKPNCIEENVNYVSEHPDAAFVFSRVEVFGPTKKIIDSFNKFANDSYLFFEIPSAEEQYESLLMNGNSVPGPTAFFNVKLLRQLNIRVDERIPLLEDYCMWLNLTKKNIKLHFIDKTLVCYRVGEGGLSSGSGSINLKYQESVRLLYFYYIFPVLFERNPDLAIKRSVDYEISLWRDIQSIQNSPSYLLGSFILKPVVFIVSFIKKLVAF